MLSLIGSAISGLIGLGSEYMTRKREEVQAKHEQKMQKIKQEGSWDEIQATNSGDSWKDEWLTVIFTLPFVAMFVAAVFDKPEVVERIRQAFIVLKTDVPDEYWYLLGVVVAASFGVKKVIDGIKAFRK